MIELALAGQLDGICFAPLNKAALHQRRLEIPRRASDVREADRTCRLLRRDERHQEFCTFRVTSHVALREAIDMVTPERIASAIRLADRTLRAMGRDAAAHRVAALNPHGGEGGLFGDEEIRIIRPAVDGCAATASTASGPLSVRRDLSEGGRRVRRRGDDVSRPGADRDQAARLQQGVTVTAGLKTVFTTPRTARPTTSSAKARPIPAPSSTRWARSQARRPARTHWLSGAT